MTEALTNFKYIEDSDSTIELHSDSQIYKLDISVFQYSISTNLYKKFLNLIDLIKDIKNGNTNIGKYWHVKASINFAANNYIMLYGNNLMRFNIQNNDQTINVHFKLDLSEHADEVLKFMERISDTVEVKASENEDSD